MDVFCWRFTGLAYKCRNILCKRKGAFKKRLIPGEIKACKRKIVKQISL
jgi:hypothetical protein